MNTIKILCIFLLTTLGSLYGSPACIDNSWHLQKKYDAKNFHPVECNCPCEKQYKIMQYRGKCWKCEHFRVPQKIEVVSCPRRAHKKDATQSWLNEFTSSLCNSAKKRAQDQTCQACVWNQER